MSTHRCRRRTLPCHSPWLRRPLGADRRACNNRAPPAHQLRPAPAFSPNVFSPNAFSPNAFSPRPAPACPQAQKRCAGHSCTHCARSAMRGRPAVGWGPGCPRPDRSTRRCTRARPQARQSSVLHSGGSHQPPTVIASRSRAISHLVHPPPPRAPSLECADRVRVEIMGLIMISTGLDSPTFSYFPGPIISTRTRLTPRSGRGGCG
jgi:hypothetical protein